MGHAGVRRLGPAAVVVALLLVCPGVSAQEARVTIAFLPFAASGRLPVLTFDVADATVGRVSLPRLSITETSSGPRVAGYSVTWRALKLGGLSFTPSYGDQRVALEFAAASLSGLRLDPRPLRGLSLSTAKGPNAVAVVLGRLDPRGGNLLASAIPRLLAVHGTLKPHRALTITPRAMTAIGPRADGAGETGVGVGGQAVLSRHFRVVGDVGGSRSARGRWAPLAVVGVVGESARGAIEASVRRAGTDFRLLGSVPFASQDREVVAGRLILTRGLAVEGQVGRTRPHDSHPQGGGTRASTVTLRIDRVRRSQLRLGHERVVDRARVKDTVTVEWRPTADEGPVVRFEQRAERDASRLVGRPLRELDVRGHAAPSRRIAVDYRVWLLLAPLSVDASRIRSRLQSRVVLTSRIVLNGEAGLRAWTRAAPGRPHTPDMVETLRVGSDIKLSRLTSVQLVYHHAPDSSKPLLQRFEGRLTRVIQF